MAGLADACPPVDDYADPDYWGGLAPIRSGPHHQSLFSASDYLLDHPRNPRPHSSALASTSSVAWRSASRRRCGDDFAAGLFHRPACKLLYPALSPGDYRREHLILSARRVSLHRCLFSSPCRDDHAGILTKNSAHLLEPADGREPSHLASHEPPGVSCGGLLGELAGPVSSKEGRGAGGKARGTSHSSGLYRRHHSLD